MVDAAGGLHAGRRQRAGLPLGAAARGDRRDAAGRQRRARPVRGRPSATPSTNACAARSPSCRPASSRPGPTSCSGRASSPRRCAHERRRPRRIGRRDAAAAARLQPGRHAPVQRARGAAGDPAAGRLPEGRDRAADAPHRADGADHHRPAGGRVAGAQAGAGARQGRPAVGADGARPRRRLFDRREDRPAQPRHAAGRLHRPGARAALAGLRFPRSGHAVRRHRQPAEDAAQGA